MYQKVEKKERLRSALEIISSLLLSSESFDAQLCCLWTCHLLYKWVVLPSTYKDGFESQNITFSRELKCASMGTCSTALQQSLGRISMSFLELILVPSDLLSMVMCIQQPRLHTVLLRNFTLRDMHLFIPNAWVTVSLQALLSLSNVCPSVVYCNFESSSKFSLQTKFFSVY